MPLAPGQGCSKLQAISSPQGIIVQQLGRRFANLVDRKYFLPRIAEQSQTSERALFINVRYLFLTMEPTNTAVNLDEAAPPNHWRKFPKIGPSLTACHFVNTEGD